MSCLSSPLLCVLKFCKHACIFLVIMFLRQAWLRSQTTEGLTVTERDVKGHTSNGCVVVRIKSQDSICTMIFWFYFFICMSVYVYVWEKVANETSEVLRPRAEMLLFPCSFPSNMLCIDRTKQIFILLFLATGFTGLFIIFMVSRSSHTPLYSEHAFIALA